ncbi:MAG: DNA replication/repair protein RecF [Clostridia bacterium]|nr:DNA replication/repair protein RecF [Clostridia bacterium]
MYIKKIKLINFRNYYNQEIILNEQLNIFFGNNAQGKTNILEAIYIGAIGKSFRAKKDKELINIGQKEAKIEIEYQKIDRQGKIKIELENKKTIYINEIKQKKLSNILGNINIVMFSPEDIEILKDGPSKRRKFLNIMIGQLKPKYIYYLNMYLKTLEQRNNYLRQIKMEKKPKELLEIWDEKLAEYSEILYQYRNEYIEKIKSKINIIHEQITKNEENIQIKYVTDYKEKIKYIQELKKNWTSDIIRGYTQKGIHKDDFIVYINGKEVSTYASQGQNRTVILSLKLSELQIIYDEIGEYPILLLDDFMSELDKNRRKNFLDNIKNTQVLITCTDDFDKKNKMWISYKVKNGNVDKL